MEIITEFTNNPLAIYIPVALALVGVVLVFTFGFKPPEQPPFDKLTIDDRKPAGKKRKIKEKKTTANGHVSSGESKQDKSPTKESKRSPIKESESKQKTEKNVEKQTEKHKKNEIIKNNNNNNNNNKQSVEEVKNKKNLKKITEKPVDYDEGNWETVPSKADKKKKPEQSPAKKEKKQPNKKVEKVEIEKLVKEVSNKELQELEKETKLKIIQNIIVIEEKKEKKKEKKVKNDEKPVEVKEVAQPKEAPKSKNEKTSSQPPPAAAAAPEVKSKEVKDSGGVAFDELGDVWTEAKVPKKSKKKSRRDN